MSKHKTEKEPELEPVDAEKIVVKDAAGRDVTIPTDGVPSESELEVLNASAEPAPRPPFKTTPGLADYPERVHVKWRGMGPFHGRVTRWLGDKATAEIVVDLPADAPPAMFGPNPGPTARVEAYYIGSELGDDDSIRWDYS